jgi:hypothetical protein
LGSCCVIKITIFTTNGGVDKNSERKQEYSKLLKIFLLATLSAAKDWEAAEKLQKSHVCYSEHSEESCLLNWI